MTTGIITAGILAKGLLAWTLSGPAEAAKGAAGDLLENFADRLFQRAPAPLRTALAAAEADILTCDSYQRLQEAEWPWVRDTAFTLLRRHNPTAEQVATQNYDADSLADRIMANAGELLDRFDKHDHQKRACRDVLHILLRHLLNQQEHLAETEAAWRGELLSRQSELLQKVIDLPKAIALHHLAGLTLLHRNAPQNIGAQINAAEMSASELLTARHTTLSLLGREGEMKTLLAWTNTKARVGVRLLTGPGGHGKTRLALELCRRLEQQGWRTGFLVDRLPDLSNIRLADLFDETVPTLITIDYAAGRMGDVQRFADLAAEWAASGRFRLLLVEREAGDWWTNRKSLPDPAGPLLRSPACLAEPLEVPTLPTGIPAEVFTEAATHFAPLLGVPVDQVQTPGISPDDLGLPLFARARALLAVEAARDGTKPPAATKDDILDHLLSRERRVWRAAARLTADDNAKLDDICTIVTLLTLSAPTHRNDALALVRRLPALANHSGETLKQWLTALHPLYGDGDLLRGLEPDLLGEHLVWRTITSAADPLLTTATGPDASEAQAQTALTILNRLAARKPETEDWLRAILDRAFDRLAVPAFRVALEQPLPMADLFREVMDRLSFEQAMTLSDLMPEYTTELLEIAAEVEQQLVNWPLPADASEEVLAFRAGRLNNLSIRLSNLGQPAKALAAVEEAVGLYRTLVKTRPNAFLPNLAAAMNTLSNHLSYLGKRDSALAAADEAIALYRNLAKRRPDAFLHDLAMALNNLSSCLSELGQLDEGLAAVEEAVDLYRNLAKTQPDVSQFNLAVSLNTLSVLLSNLGRGKRALVAVDEAVGHFRSLAKTRPDAYLPDLAMALNNLSVNLSSLGHWGKALAAVEEAVVIRRTLVESRPDTFLPVLALSISVLRDCLQEARRFDDALAAAREALTLLFPLFCRLPAAHGRQIALYWSDYIESAEEAGQEPDRALLALIIAALIEHDLLPRPDTPSPA
ncbi:hypothetical protein IP70_06750 [alpha proteobacterium AAP38]|nr:hypothetical protein IP70_06750 [alpha proteobacterium AAP38]